MGERVNKAKRVARGSLLVFVGGLVGYGLSAIPETPEQADWIIPRGDGCVEARVLEGKIGTFVISLPGGEVELTKIPTETAGVQAGYSLLIDATGNDKDMPIIDNPAASLPLLTGPDDILPGTVVGTRQVVLRANGISVINSDQMHGLVFSSPEDSSTLLIQAVKNDRYAAESFCP